MDYLLKRPDTQARCTWKILTSKRMLADHLEVVEMCLKLDHNIDHVGKVVFPRRTVCGGCICIIAATTRFSPSYIINKWQIAASAASALLLGAMVYKELVVYRDVALVTSLIESIELYDQAMKKVLMFELYHIFLYIQSHCLLRLSLAILSGLKIGDIRNEANHIIRCLTSHANELKKQIMLREVSQLADLEMMNVVKQVGSNELLSLKHQSLELTVKLMANVQQFVLIDENIQSHTSPPSFVGLMQLRDTANNLAAIHSNFITRVDECERLLITVKKLLNNIEDPKQNDEDPANMEPAKEGTFDELLPESQNAAHELRDEFFVNTGTEGEEDPNDSTATLYSLQADDELVAKRLMKKQFQPILQQLRERLVPVEEEFKERERVALELKGIVMQDEDEAYDAYRSRMSNRPVAIETDDESDSEELDMKLKYNRSQNKYKDDRDFLASKPQISFLASLPKVVQMDENILE
uniref:Uncharacterized protein n=1 Tax=Anopheles culicifacies TaxID=139723 RepID=A0A182MTR4_9DIPT